MQDFLTFWSAILSDICSFLLSEPIVWFMGVLLLFAIAKLFKYIVSFN